MDLIVLQQNLAKSLNTATHFVSNKAALPILSNVVLSAKSNKLTIKATNLEMSFSVDIGAQVKTEGSIALPAKSLSDLINNLNKSQIELKTNDESLLINSDNFEGKMSGINISDFPQIPETLNIESTVEISKESFFETLSSVLFSCSQDEGRPILTGVLFLFSSNTLTVVSTDGFRLSKKTITLNQKNEIPDFKMIVPRNILMEILKLSQDGESIFFKFIEEENQVVFKISDIVLSSRIIQGDFPNFDKIIPKEEVFSVSCSREELHRATKLASVIARESSFAGKLRVIGKGLEIVSESSSLGAHQKNIIEAKTKGGDFEIIFNLKFIEDFLTTQKGESIDIVFRDTTSPGIFRDPNNPNYLHLIMPVRS